MIDLKESVAEIAVSNAMALIRGVAEKYEPVRYAHIIKHGKDEHHLYEDGSMEEFCEKCIQAAVARARINFFKERREFMGKIYEISRWGYHSYIEDLQDDCDNVIGCALSKEKIPEGYTKKKAVKELEARLEKEFDINKVFTSESLDTYGNASTNFRNCEGCGVIFGYTPIFNTQEVEHWESYPEVDLKDPYTTYQLFTLFDNYRYFESDVRIRIGAIAAKIIGHQG